MPPSPPRVFNPPNPSPIPFDPRSKELRDALGTAADASGATFFESKLVQPTKTRVVLDGSQDIYTVDAPWEGDYTVQSLTLVNPYLFPIYVVENGDPLMGIPFPPQAITRLPLSGNNGSFVVGAAQSDLASDEAIVWLFRWALPD
jgi:hypothetical protein